MANKNVSQERMKAKTLFLLLLAMALMSGGVARQRVFSVSGRVIDTSGEGVEGVVVNNGRQFTQTDQDGRWSLLTDTLVSKYISISTPADFCLPAADGIAAGFYVSVGEAIAQKGHDFVLRRRTHKADDFYYVAISDPQVRNESDLRRWREETMADVRRVADSLGDEREVVGVTLGDLVFDDMALYAPYAQSVSNSGMTMFSCIGNHDFDRRWKDLDSMRLGAPAYAEKKYNERFGPTDYSFNIGKAHVVTMKNINYLGNGRYVERMTDEQLEWLANDLSYVPRGSLVLLNIHAPGWGSVNKADIMSAADRLAEVLRGYRVHVFCGHTHYFQNVEVSESLYQHNIGAACGAWWQGKVNCCGAPNGYLVVSVEGDRLRWRYKATGTSPDVQMSVYGQGEWPSLAEDIVANVWDYDPRCRVEWWQDGRAMGEMERFSAVDAAYQSQSGPRSMRIATSHLFRCRPKGRYKKIEIVFTNRFGERFREVVKGES